MSKLLSALIATAFAASASIAVAQTAAPAPAAPAAAPAATKAEKIQKGVAQEKALEDASKASTTGGVGAKTTVDNTAKPADPIMNRVATSVFRRLGLRRTGGVSGRPPPAA
jgi:pectate lyase